MRIVHANAQSSPATVDGVNATIWTVAAEQASSGHDVGVVLGRPSRDAIAFAERHQLQLHSVKPTLEGYRKDLDRILAEHQPEVIHLHSAFAVRLAIATIVAARRDVGLVMTPHGGLHPSVLERGALRKRLYSLLVEHRRFRRAAAITALLPAEKDHIERFVPGFEGRLSIVPAPVEGLEVVAGARKQGPIVFLGRYDVRHKGLDRWLDIARQMPDLSFQLYGDGADRDLLAARCPMNVRINGPVFGEEKREVLSNAAMYLQTSRWESFGISVAEAMLAGTPVAVTDSMDIASLLAAEDLGLVIPTATDEAVRALGEALHDEATLSRRTAAARSYAEGHFTPSRVAAAYVAVYKDVA